MPLHRFQVGDHVKIRNSEGLIIFRSPTGRCSVELDKGGVEVAQEDELTLLNIKEKE